MSNGHLALCPRCNKVRRNNSPHEFTWWSVRGIGRMCWHCYDKLIRKQ